ncbi:Tn3 family transposase, partial [Streptomyces sp. NPDC055105]|uniref:Tn3 family transposase n=1 Tax=Streptomyces sp. NPDC055105 TaxID=3365719 RepID=UPI0037D301B3
SHQPTVPEQLLNQALPRSRIPQIDHNPIRALVPFNTGYMDAAGTQLRADRFDVREADVARLSPFVRHHINMLGRYSFQLPELPGGLRPLRDPGADDDR